jgi:hypothetical protein
MGSITRYCETVNSLSDAIDDFVATGRVANPIPKKRKTTLKLEAMTKSELVEFAKFLYSPITFNGIGDYNK